MRRPIDMTGARVGRLAVIGRAPTPAGSTKAFWTCRCDCGNETRVPGVRLRGPRPTRSCGCLVRDTLATFRVVGGPGRPPTHGLSQTLEYHSWINMIYRCTRPDHPQWANYGGRGITVCDRWLDPEQGMNNFYADMGPRPSPDLSIDRIDNDGNYEPGNCRWADDKTQRANQRRCAKTDN